MTVVSRKTEAEIIESSTRTTIRMRVRVFAIQVVKSYRPHWGDLAIPLFTTLAVLGWVETGAWPWFVWVPFMGFPVAWHLRTRNRWLDGQVARVMDQRYGRGNWS